MPAWEKDTDTIGEEYESSLSSWDDEEEIEIDENPISAREFYQALRGYGKRLNRHRCVPAGFRCSDSGETCHGRR